jgi:hypothetical protein
MKVLEWIFSTPETQRPQTLEECLRQKEQRRRQEEQGRRQQEEEDEEFEEERARCRRYLLSVETAELMGYLKPKTKR